MKKNTTIILGICAVALLLVAIAGMYKFNYLASQVGYDVDGNKINTAVHASNPRNTTYSVNNELITLVDGLSEMDIVSGSASQVVTKYFGNEMQTDLNNDGREDVVFLLTQNTGGTGTFFYVVAALNTETGWVGSQGLLLGDRISPQTTEMSQNPNHKNVVVVNYMDRANDQAMSEQPSVGKSIWLKFDSETMSFGEVEQNFSGEANPDSMTLDMKTWTWVRTTYNNDTELTPDQSAAFTLTFAEDSSLTATTNCNTMRGNYEVEGNTLTFEEIASTRMYCEDSQEQEFFKMLGEVQSFFFTRKGELVFDLKFDSGSSIFR